MSYKVYAQYKFPVAATALAAASITEIASVRATGNTPVVRISPIGSNMVLAFGDAAVTADATENGTTKRLSSGNIYCADGVTETFALRGDETHFSVISADEVSLGSVMVSIGYGE